MATPIPVTDPDDPRLEPFRAIRERDLVGRQERFVAEGEVVLRVLLAADRFETETILVSERVAAGGRDWFGLVGGRTVLLSASDDVIADLAGFHVHRGILAIGRRKHAPGLDALLAGLPERALVLACVGIANHDNMGGLFRNAAAFGAAAVLCDATCCDPLYRKAIRVSVGGVFRTPFVCGGTGAEIVQALGAHGFRTVALSPSGGVALHEALRSPRMALLVGAEGPGLPQELLDQLETARIAMAPGFDSLNVGVSAGIALHHFFSQ